MLPAAYQSFVRRISGRIDSRRIYTDPLSTLTYGTDASCYQLRPKVVVKTHNEDEVRLLLAEAAALALPVTFRAAGTSLSGQAVSDSILLVAGDAWNRLEVLEEGAAIRLQPGVLGAAANAALLPYGRKIGPDPATLNAAMIGGIVNNNASGMCCGTAQNSYRTVRSLRLILADGTLLDTADEASVAAFRQSHAGLLSALSALAQRVQEDETLAERIRRKYKMKNTTGYSLNALVDYTDPLAILLHLMVGSEGTLAFVSEVVYHTVPDWAHKASALVFYPDIGTACQAIALLAQHKDQVAAAELLDRASLRSVQDKAGVPALIRSLPDSAAAILIETRAESAADLQRQSAAISDFLAPFTALSPLVFSSDAAETTRLWNIRKGMFPSVGAMRASGTTVIIEDVVFPIEHLAQGTLKLQALFQCHGYHEAIIFGHALEGNLHFVFTPDFSGAAEIGRYQAFLEDVCQLVAVEYEGAVKAEHGTGRNMAPFVELEWGADAYRVMQEIKLLFDPEGMLNPDVILSQDKLLHVKHLKPMPAANPIIDKCIECGFCEAQCPSRALTLTPRQRIVARREIAALLASGTEPAALQQMEAAYVYAGEQTCVACGLCETACPVGINTGALTLGLREAALGERARKGAATLARHYGLASSAARTGLRLLAGFERVAGEGGTAALMQGLRRVLGARVPHWSRHFPRGAGRFSALPGKADSVRKVVYLSSCLTRTFVPSSAAPDARPVNQVVASVLEKAGYALLYPADLGNLCCGTPFHSKGAMDAAQAKRMEVEAALLLASDNGRWPVIVDNGVCTVALLEGLQDTPLQIYDVTRFVHEVAADYLQFSPVDEDVALHVVCSMRKSGQAGMLEALARRCANRVTVPGGVTCCGFAGDKGFTFPELNASALKDLRPQVAHCSGGYANSATCEIGLSEHSGLDYQHLMVLVDKVTRAL
ncbi:FAD-binding and (Fe-S)-binding domain-containing protein [Craterilacuibacter sp. RT1T]|uniref:FAD-binding and (Fe-S)-binding domain-containing protein n=1 Tax=Craterilacuibacter sp. RT1T TaxID=2942211 RepID=UPI0020BF3067|nr:FAD-binding and (Fe-S)-binding domain-containing protein [Craterilacuibacter sp. RT1T]MCL6263699.1 FAD-binding oxidoreductase [Craterilacuibacter sp. RT1T]